MFRVFAKPTFPLCSALKASKASRFVATPLTPLCRMYSNKLTPGSPVFAAGDSPVVKYTENHEWIAVHGGKTAFVGITKYAADALGDTTFVEVIDVPTDVEAEDTLGSVESVKSASDVYSPVAGTLVEANETLISNPALLNQDPMGAAWIAKLEISDPAALDALLTLEDYEKSLEDH